MDSKSLGIGVVAGLLIGVGAGYMIQNASSARDAAADSAQKSANSGSSIESDALKQDRIDLQARLSAANEKIQKLEAAASRQPMAVKNTGDEEELQRGATAKSASAKIGMLYADADYKAILEQIDWDAAGEVTQKMIPVLDQIVEAVLNDKPIENPGDVQKLNGELVNLAVKAQKGGVPGTGPNGSFTHPSVSANLLNAVLEKANQSLTPEQRATLQTLAKHYADLDAQQRSQYDENTTDLQRLLDESLIKDRFYGEWGTLLNSNQKNVIFRDSTQGRLGTDLWSSGLGWRASARPVFAENAADFGRQIGKSISGDLDLDSKEQEKFDSIVSKWASSLPSDTFNQSADAHSQKGWMRVGRVEEAAAQQLELQRMLLNSLNLSPRAREALKRKIGVGVPFKKQ